MTGDSDFRIRPGRIRSTRAQAARPFIAQALAAAKKARRPRVSRSGRIRVRQPLALRARASVRASGRTGCSPRERAALVIKARVVRQTSRSAPLADPPQLSAPRRRDPRWGEGPSLRSGGDDADPKAFAERCQDDRHHFRFIVSPDDAPSTWPTCGPSPAICRRRRWKRISTPSLDWVAVDHWNTEHPHVHLIVRGGP